MFLERYRSVIAPPGKACIPVIDAEKCKGCGYCIRICPLGAIELRDKKAIVVPRMKMGDTMQPSCFGCRDCTVVCPEGAITVEGQVIIDEGFYKSSYRERPIRMPQPLGEGKPLSEDMAELTEVEKVIFRRRSNRIFKKDPVPTEIIERLLEAARFAPTAGNSQPVRYIVITDRAVIDEIRDGITPLLKMLSKQYKEGGKFIRSILSWWGLRNPGDMDIRPIYAVEAFNAPGTKLHLFQHAPVLILVLGDKRGVGDFKLECGMAAQNLVLAAHSMNLGTCYVGFIKRLT